MQSLPTFIYRRWKNCQKVNLMSIPVSSMVIMSYIVVYWAGLSTDLVIEQVLMRSIKSTGGLTRGRGMAEIQRLLWLLPTVWTKKSTKKVQKQVRGCLQNLYQSVAIHLKYILLVLL